MEPGNTERPFGPQLGLKGHVLVERQAWNKGNNCQMREFTLSKRKEREKERKNMFRENKISI